MRAIRRSILLPYSAPSMFDLVARVEDYPRFLPWCGASHVLEQRPDGMVVTLEIAYGGVRHAFTTENRHEPGRRIEMTLRDGPFSHLAGQWEFLALSADGCKVSFELDYAFSSPLLERVVGPVFGRVTGSLVDAFVRRADTVYG
ncbi:MAG: type II toxin-antitoxin system RatA family toxin [Burkholderiales bacterium]|nr:MAG: type II toxin-antitoxin system RatA family toxin [Burkholderiales bacterium]